MAKRFFCWSQTSNGRSAGLRDLQFVRWIGFTAIGETDYDALAERGWLTKQEHRACEKLAIFCFGFATSCIFNQKAKDVLDRSDQLRIAELRRLSAGDGPVAGRAIHARIFSAHQQRARNRRRIWRNRAAAFIW